MHEIASQSLAVFFLMIGLLIGAVVRELNKRLNVPYTPMLFILGVLLGYYKEYLGMLGDAAEQVSRINPHGILMIFLPPLIFESGFNSDWHIFRKQSKQIFILAFPSVVVSAALVMVSLKIVIGYTDEYFTWVGAFLFGAILSCTDTVAVLALLKEVGAPKKFNSLIEGESLLNDGTCMVLFTICAEMMTGSGMSVKGTISLFFSLTIGGALLGLLFGILAAAMINRVRNDPMLTLNITFCSCFILYFVAENVNLGFRVSGIMALVSMGLYMAAFGKTRISAEAKESVHSFWKYIIYVAETTIFLLAGILVGIKVIGDLGTPAIVRGNFQKMGMLYICMIFARFFSIVVFMPTLKKSGYGLTMKEVYVLTYGGLRGAVGIAFSLIISSDERFPQKFRTFVLFNMAGCAFLTLVINAPTAGLVIRKLGLCVKSEVRTKLFTSFMKGLSQDIAERLNELKQNKYLEGADWTKVAEISGYNDVVATTRLCQSSVGKSISMSRISRPGKSIFSPGLQQPRLSDISLLSEYNLDEEMLMECRNRFLFALKGLYWEKYEDHQCSSQSVVLLVEAVDWDLDTIKEPMNSWDYLESHLQNPTFISLCFQLKNYPIIGRHAFSALFNRVSFIYDVVSTYVQTLEMCELEIQEMPMDREIKDEIIKESSENRELAMSYLDYYIRVSFPEITQKIQMIKASQTILTHLKLIINIHFEHGQLDEKEYKQLKNVLDGNIMQLEDIGYNWQEEDRDLDNQMKKSEFFSLMTPEQRKHLMQLKFEKLLQKDDFIIKTDEKARFLFLITRGEATEETDRSGHSYLRKLTAGDLIGASNTIKKNLRYATSVCSNSIMTVVAFPLNEIQSIIKANEELQGYLYKYCLPLLSRTNPNLDIFSNFTSEDWASLRKILEYSRLQPNESVKCKFGEIVLDGKVKCGEKIVEGPCFIPWAPEERILTALSKCRVLQIKVKVTLDGSKYLKKHTFLNRISQRPSSRTTQNYFLPSTQNKHQRNYFINKPLREPDSSEHGMA